MVSLTKNVNGKRSTDETLSNERVVTCPICEQTYLLRYGENTSCEWSFSAALFSASDMGTFFSPSRTETARIKSSELGEEKTAKELIMSFPIFSTEIQVLAGMKTMAPACTSRTASPKCTRAVPDWRKRISSESRCL